ncbi:hypothetical protein [Streptomyces violarus]|nr:hypothetical protein [Streptomyces violarus]MCT9137698.1 hypothetical protein [Streptomyces violarus]
MILIETFAAALTITASVTASAHSTASAAPGSPALTPPLGWNKVFVERHP